MHENYDVKIFWCDNCKIPLINPSYKKMHTCSLCGNGIAYISRDIRPVFPEERLLFEFFTQREPYQYLRSSVWCNNSTYYVDGIANKLSGEMWRNNDPDAVRRWLKEHREKNTYEYFNEHVERFFNCE